MGKYSTDSGDKIASSREDSKLCRMWDNNRYRLCLNYSAISEFSQTGISFDRVAETYDKTRSLPSKVVKQLIKTLTNVLNGCQTILDLGIGTVRFTKPLQDLEFEVVGIDISRKMISKAREKGVNNILLGDARFLHFKDNTFDATICIHLLHLISQWKMALRETCRVTRDFMFSLLHANRDPVREARYIICLESLGAAAIKIRIANGFEPILS